jgi:hypothetical protein
MSWEQDFSPNPETAVCAQCGQVHIADASVKKTVFVERGREETYVFCSTRCSHDFFLARLRQLWEEF